MHIRKILAAAVGVMTMSAFIPATAAQADSAEIHASNGKLYSAGKPMRAASFKHTLVLTAPNWGQDWQGVMQNNAKTVYQNDSNVVFDVHMYGVYSSASKVTSYIDSFVNQGLPLMVGEFGNKHSDGIPDAATIMRYTKEEGVGCWPGPGEATAAASSTWIWSTAGMRDRCLTGATCSSVERMV